MNSQSPKISQLESTNSILHLPANYEAALTEVTNESLVALGGLGSWVSDFEQSGMSLDNFTRQRSQLIGDTFSDTAKTINGIINSVPGILDGLRDFSQADKALWVKTRTDYPYTPSTSMSDMRRRASSGNASNAIHVGMDDLTFDKGRTDYPYTPTSALREMRQRASSTTASDAMHVGVDDLTFSKGRTDYPYTPTSALREMRQRASSTRAGDKFEAEVRKNDATTNQQRDSGRSSQSGNQGRQQRDSRQERPRANSSKEHTRAPDAYDELMTTLRRAEDRGLFSTIQGFERTEVAKVIATVKHLREKNPDITDKEIALKYARLSNNAERSSPERQRATQIVMSLMGDKVSGKLPF